MNARAVAVAELAARLGHDFADPALLERALTHSSVGDGATHPRRGAARDNERLEFLGDRVLGLMTAERLLARFPDAAEGEMAPRLNRLVSREACARVGFVVSASLIRKALHGPTGPGRRPFRRTGGTARRRWRVRRPPPPPAR